MSETEEELLQKIRVIREQKEKDEKASKLKAREDAYQRCLGQEYVKDVSDYPHCVTYRKIANVRKKEESRGEFVTICDVHQDVRVVSRERDEDGFFAEGKTYQSSADITTYTKPLTRTHNFIHDTEQVISKEEFERAVIFASKIAVLHQEFFNQA